jgi:hypothetical protein
VINGVLGRWHGAPNENGYSRVALLSRRMKFSLFFVCAQVDVHSVDNWNLVVGQVHDVPYLHLVNVTHM